MKEKKKMKKRTKVFLITIISIFSLGLSTGLFLLYGPYHGFRDWLITSAMTTMNHKYLATMFYSDKTIEKVLENNKVIEPKEDTNTDLIIINDQKIKNKVYKDKYDKEILDVPENTPYKIININEQGFKGFLAAVYDPSKIKVVASKNLGIKGQYLVDMAKENNAILAINGGGFIDPEGLGNGGIPVGSIIKDGKILNGGGKSNVSSSGGIIGFTNENKLFLGKVSAEEAINQGVRDAVEFRPFLVVNGKSSYISGNGGWGLAPRTAIGQRQDGIVLFLVIDGRSITSLGADMNHLAEIMVRYGAYNAANLDGGNSSVMVVDNKIINNPIAWFDVKGTRPIPTGFIVIE